MCVFGHMCTRLVKARGVTQLGASFRCREGLHGSASDQPPIHPPTEWLGKAAGGPGAGKPQGGRTTPARHALQLDKVKLQTDRCRQSPARRPAWPGLKFARALHALGGLEPPNA